MKNYSQAAANAGAYELAADLLVALERIKTGVNYATNIGFYYNRAGRNQKGNEWHRTAYSREKNATTAYNMYCISTNKSDEEKYLREALRYDPSHILALQALAAMLAGRSSEEATKLNKRVVDLLSPDYRDPDTDVSNLNHLLKAARATNQENLAQKVEREIHRRGRALSSSGELYREDHLAASYDNRQHLIAEK